MIRLFDFIWKIKFLKYIFSFPILIAEWREGLTADLWKLQ